MLACSCAVQIAVEVVRAVAPSLPACGIVAWQAQPWDCLDHGRPDCHGQAEAVLGPPVLDVVAGPRIELTATVEQLGHLVGWSDGAPGFEAWVEARNLELAKRLGR
jgi:hypothetical protein